jgi:hypothetical protein
VVAPTARMTDAIPRASVVSAQRNIARALVADARPDTRSELLVAAPCMRN